jgi:hypothetical protein
MNLRVRREADVARTLRMTDMKSQTQEQVLGAPDQSYWFQVNFEDINAGCDVINASQVPSDGIA